MIAGRSPKIEKVTKVDAARRQLSTAIRLFFERRDTIYPRLGRPRHHARPAREAGAGQGQLPQERHGRSAGEKRAEYFKLITDAQNFFKHADREPANAVLEFYPEPIAFSLLDVVDMATPGATTRTRSCSSCGSA